MNLDQLAGQLSAHPKQALGAGGAAVGVIGYALYRRNKAAAAAGTTSPNTVAATGTNPGTTGTSAVAGLSGTPNTQATDIENWVNDQLNAFESGQAGAATTTAPPVTPAGLAFDPTNPNTILNTATGGRYQVQSAGDVYLNGPEYASLGSPAAVSTYADPKQIGQANVVYGTPYAQAPATGIPTGAVAKYGPAVPGRPAVAQ